MSNAVRNLAYLLALAASAALTASIAWRFLPLLPQGAVGALILVLLVALIAGCVGVLESKLLFRLWNPTRRPSRITQGARSSLLSGWAPWPLSLGVVIGSLIAVRLA